jgi:hypothetical protein
MHHPALLMGVYGHVYQDRTTLHTRSLIKSDELTTMGRILDVIMELALACTCSFLEPMPMSNERGKATEASPLPVFGALLHLS